MFGLVMKKKLGKYGKFHGAKRVHGLLGADLLIFFMKHEIYGWKCTILRQIKRETINKHKACSEFFAPLSTFPFKKPDPQHFDWQVKNSHIACLPILLDPKRIKI